MAGFEVGIIATIFFGGLAGWLAGKVMDMRFGVFMNIVSALSVRRSPPPYSAASAFSLRDCSAT